MVCSRACSCSRCPAAAIRTSFSRLCRCWSGGKPLDVARDGHSAPFVGDFDGDGKRDLLVGQYHEGRLRIYRNRGDNVRPRFDDFTWFEAEGRPGRVPEG